MNKATRFFAQIDDLLPAVFVLEMRRKARRIGYVGVTFGSLYLAAITIGLIVLYDYNLSIVVYTLIGGFFGRGHLYVCVAIVIIFTPLIRIVSLRNIDPLLVASSLTDVETLYGFYWVSFYGAFTMCCTILRGYLFFTYVIYFQCG